MPQLGMKNLKNQFRYKKSNESKKETFRYENDPKRKNQKHPDAKKDGNFVRVVV